jgi:colanic acid biosynthesis glycosyl transferase WcaI
MRMNILIISQVFWPDSTAVSQVMTDLAEELSHRGHRVNVISSRLAYENPKNRFMARETHRGVNIRRTWQTSFGKKTKVGRVLDFATFNMSLFFHLVFIRKNDYDFILGSTVPPLSSFFGVFIARTKKIPFGFWAMDLQPELAIVAGYLKKESRRAKLLAAMGDHILKNTDLIIALDRFMAEHIQQRVPRPLRIRTLPVWPVMSEIYDGPRMDNPFRRRNNFGDRLVVMYSGNMSVMHPLDSLLQAASKLREEDRFLFVFIGGGVQKNDIARFKDENRLTNILMLPLQRRDQIHFSLGAADLHVVALGNGCVGLTHPNKIYGAMFIGRPILYIGPRPSHVTDILDQCPGNLSVAHGQPDEIVIQLNAFARQSEAERAVVGRNNRDYAVKNFFPDQLKDALICEITSFAK